MKWFVYIRGGEIKGPFDKKYIALMYMNNTETGIMKRYSAGHYENQYGEIVATKEIMEALGYEINK